MSIVFKCENCGVIIDKSDDCYVIGKRHFDNIDLCWDCFMTALDLGDGKYFGWMGAKKVLMKLLKAATR